MTWLPPVKNHQDEFLSPMCCGSLKVVAMPSPTPTCLLRVLCEGSNEQTQAYGPNTSNLYINKNIGLITPHSAKIRPKCSIFHVFLLIKNEMKEKRNYQNYINKNRWNAVLEAVVYNNIPFNKIHWLIWLIKAVLKLKKN